MRLVSVHTLRAFTFATLTAALCIQAADHVTKIQANQLVTNGESFFAAGNITTELTRLARRDGYIGSNESFKSVSVSGQPIATILKQYQNCNPKPTYLISDGGGIDLMQGNCTNADCQVIKNCKSTLLQYLDEMKKNGTKKLLWMIYPDPVGAQWATLKKNQDIWAEVAPVVVAASQDPKCIVVDLRKTWAGHYAEYTNDGIHCTNAGGTATAEAFWKAMIDSNFFDLPVAVNSPSTVKKTSSALRSQRVGEGTIALSLQMEHPSKVSLQLTTVSGRNVYSHAQQVEGSGVQQVTFPLNNLACGIYFGKVTASRQTVLTKVMIP